MSPVDLKILVDSNENRLRYRLDSQAFGLALSDFGTVNLTKMDREAFLLRFFRSFEEHPLHGGQREHGPSHRERGLELFDVLLPEKLKSFLWRNRHGVRTLNIVSEEAWIPWELMKLHGESRGRVEEDCFFGEVFHISRWFAGKAPASRFALANTAWVLGGTEGEALIEGAFEDLNEVLSGEVEEIPFALTRIEDALASGRYDHWLFFGHAWTTSGNPDEGRFGPASGQGLTPQSLLGVGRNLGAAKPLVFMAACNTARAGERLSGFGGWPKRFVDAGAGAFIGTLWPVSPVVCCKFMDYFYLSFSEGKPIAEAFQRARVKSFDEDDWSSLGFLQNADHNAVYEPLPQATRAEPVRGPLTRKKPPSRHFKPARSRPVFSDHRVGRVLIWSLPVLLLLACPFLGTLAHRARESMLRVDALSYPLGVKIEVGIDMLWTAITRGLGALFADPLLILTGSWLALIASALLWFLKNRLPWWTMFLVLLLWVGLLFSQTVFVIVGVRARNLMADFPDQPLPSANLADRTAFETWSWLVNEGSRNDQRRENLNGFLVWLIAANLWAVLLTLRLRNRWIRLLALAYSLLAVLLIRELPRGYAYAEWGLAYPTVVLDATCAATVGEPGFDPACCLFDISAGAKEKVLWVACRHSVSGRSVTLRAELDACLSRSTRKPRSIHQPSCQTGKNPE